jgi:uncharacterized membrane protein
MKAQEVLLPGISGTTFMTLFSYLVSAAKKENFSEPERLGQLVHNLLPILNKQEKKLTGWTAHYLVGLLFAMAYAELWRKKKIKPNLRYDLLLGAASGLIAVVVWKATFEAHPLPPVFSFNAYYLQLVPAHVVFAVSAGIGYRLLKKFEQNHEKRRGRQAGNHDENPAPLLAG